MMRLTLSAGVVAMLIFGCSSTSSNGSAPASSIDAGTPEADAAVAEAGARATLGGACASDADCADGLECLKSASAIERWPGRGLCTLKCDASNVEAPAGESTCTSHTPGSHCLKVGSSQGYCVEGCELSPTPLTSLSTGQLPRKCHGRNEMACKLTPSGGLGCYPSCNSDAACSAGEKCEVSGFCTRGSAPGWDQIGQTAAPGPGGCSFVTGSAPDELCTARCTVGVVPSCSWSGPGAKAQAACLKIYSGAGQGDSGLCVGLCDCESDCTAPYKCAPLSATLAAETGRAGVCTMTPVSNISCGDAGSDGG